MAKKKMKKMDPKNLRAAAKEIQDILAPEDDEGNEIEMAKGSVQEMQDKIIAAAEVLTLDDELSDNLQSVLDFLNVKISSDEEDEEPEDEEEAAETDDEPEDEEDEEDEESDPELEEEDLVDIVTGTKKLDELKDLVAIHPEFKSLKKGLDTYKGLAGPRDLKAKMMKLLGVDTEKKAAPVAKGKKTPATLRICQLVCENFDVKKETIIKVLAKEEYTTSDTTVGMQMNDTLKAINTLKDMGKL